MNLLALLSFGSSALSHHFEQLFALMYGITLYWMLMPYRMYTALFSFFFSAAVSTTQKEVILAAEKKKREAIVAENKHKDRQVIVM